MTDLITTAIASAMATAIADQAAHALTTQTARLLAEIRRRVHQKFHDRPGDLAVFTRTQNEPSSQERISQLAEALRQAAHQDPEFGREILALWTQARDQITNLSDSANVFQGLADKVVQLRDVHGGLTIN